MFSVINRMTAEVQKGEKEITFFYCWRCGNTVERNSPINIQGKQGHLQQQPEMRKLITSDPGHYS